MTPRTDESSPDRRYRRFLARLTEVGSIDEIAAEHALVLRHRMRALVRVDQPLVLIAQIGRSGGTLLMRLFDAHRQCHTVPHELSRIVRGIPAVVEGTVEPWTALTPAQQRGRLEVGYQQSRGRLHGDSKDHPFLLPPLLHQAIFNHCLKKSAGSAPRDVLNCYLTGYFNGWLDNVSLRTGPKRWVVGFEPNLIPVPPEFHQIWPDGRVISIVRDPWNWYASARRFNPADYGELEPALGRWRAATEASLHDQASAPDRFRLVSFSSLVAETEETMQSLASWLAIDFETSLLEPTFNGRGITANSSFAAETPDVSTAPLGRARQTLSAQELAYIDEHAGELYDRALAATVDAGRARVA